MLTVSHEGTGPKPAYRHTSTAAAALPSCSATSNEASVLSGSFGGFWGGCSMASSSRRAALPIAAARRARDGLPAACRNTGWCGGTRLPLAGLVHTRVVHVLAGAGSRGEDCPSQTLGIATIAAAGAGGRWCCVDMRRPPIVLLGA